jgi:Ca2+-binding EF-hand superfamily protein
VVDADELENDLESFGQKRSSRSSSTMHMLDSVTKSDEMQVDFEELLCDPHERIGSIWSY